MVHKTIQSHNIKENQSLPVVKVVKADFTQELLQQGEGGLIIRLGSTQNMKRKSWEHKSEGGPVDGELLRKHQGYRSILAKQDLC